ncbi:MAG TPA: acyltransferase, partial [Clostridiaceae bacterium]|nr:acyltransferase [Clostridiaceae bacterium]
MRKHYIDNIRWATVLLVLVYHVFYLFNSVGVLGGVGSFSEVQYQDAVLYFVYPWFMVLLFLIAGISS